MKQCEDAPIKAPTQTLEAAEEIAPVKVPVLMLALKVAEAVAAESKVPMTYGDVNMAAGRISVLQLSLRKFHPYARITSVGSDGWQPDIRYEVFIPSRMPRGIFGFKDDGRIQELADVLEATIVSALTHAKNGYG